MTAFLLAFAENVIDTTKATGCSITRAVDLHLEELPIDTLLKLRDAAIDLQGKAEAAVQAKQLHADDEADAPRLVVAPPALDRRLRLRVYRDGRIVVHVDAPALGRMLSHTTVQGWRAALAVLERCEREWSGLAWAVVVKHQGILS